MNNIFNTKFQKGSFIKYLANTSWLIGEKIVRLIVLLFVGIYVARYLGPEKFGIYSYALSFVGLFTIFTSLGLDAITVRDLVKNSKQKNILLGSTFILKLIGSATTIIIIASILSQINENPLTNKIILIIAFGFIFQTFNVIGLYFESTVQSKFLVYAKLLPLITSSILKIYFVIINATLIWFAYIALLDSFLFTLGLIFFYTKNSQNIFSWKIDRHTSIFLLKNSWPLILSGLAVSIYMKIDQIMIKNILGVTQVGFYAAAVKLSEAWYFIPVLICTSIFPAIINVREKSKELYLLRLKNLYTLMIWIILPIAILITIFSNDIISLLYGPKFQAASTVLKIHIWAGIFVFLGVASGKYLIAENFTKISFMRTFIGMISNVALNIVLIPRYGINGAAIATVISYGIATFLIFFIPKTFGQAILMLKAFVFWKSSNDFKQ